jgi:hypothetical protein
MDCDRRCIDKTGRWCDQCWRKILRGGWRFTHPTNPEGGTER